MVNTMKENEYIVSVQVIKYSYFKSINHCKFGIFHSSKTLFLNIYCIMS